MSNTTLTWAQKIIWTGQNVVPGGAHLNQTYSLDLIGALDIAAFEAAFAALALECDALRLVIHADGDFATQTADGTPPMLEKLTLKDRADADAWMQNRALQPFDLTVCGSAIALIRLSATHHVVCFIQHHVVCDGISSGLLIKALADRYNAALNADMPAPLPAYLETAKDHSAPNPSSDFEASCDLAPVPLYGREPAPGGTQKISHKLDFTPSRQAAWIALAQSEAFRTFPPALAQQNILASLTAAWMARVSGQSDVGFVMPQQNRTTPDVRKTIGLFMELLPLVIEVTPADSFASLNARIATTTQQMLFKGGPGSTRVDLLSQRNVVLNIYTGEQATFEGLETHAEKLPMLCSDPSHDVNIEFSDLGGTGDFSARMTFDATRFDEQARRTAVAHFQTLMDAFFADPDAKIATIDILTQAEKASIDGFNARADDPQPSGTILDRINAGLSAAPAVRNAKTGQSLTHIELDQAANRLANLLAERGAKSGDRIAICLPRSVDTIVSILAAHKLGAAFVPLEATLSSERRDFILADTGARLVISDQDLPDAIHPADAHSHPETPVVCKVTADMPAYVIYTSGSTGAPKGVVVSHGALLGYCQTCLDQYPLAPGKSFAFFSAFGFDLTINSLFMPLISAGEIVVYPEPEIGGDLAILDVLADDAVDIVKPTPSHLRIGLLMATKPLKRIKYMPHSGEAFPSELARAAYEKLGQHLDLMNEYGPTEAVVGAMLHHYNPTDSGPLVPLGRPAPGMRILVVNSQTMPQPHNVPGEIAIAGRLAQGYLNRDKLNAEKFVPDPRNPGERLYLTGDLGVFQASGALSYLGRMDDQIKLNGIRLELGDIEHALSKVDGVSGAVAALKTSQGGAPALVVYVQGNAQSSDIQEAAKNILPISVRLGAIVHLDALPISSNGKIARARLPEPAPGNWIQTTGSRAPNTGPETDLARIWADILGLDSIGAEDDFYALGGDSLSAVRITHAARASGLEVAAVDIFRCRTVAGLAAQLEPANKNAPMAPRTRFSRISGDAQAKLTQALRRRP